MSDTEPEDPLYEAYLENAEMEHLKSYLERGRAFAALDEQALQQRYVAAYRAWAADPKNREALRGVRDVVAEFRLRNQAEPFELVLDEMRAIFTYAAQVAADLKQRVEDPVVQAIVGGDFLAFAKAAHDPKAKN